MTFPLSTMSRAKGGTQANSRAAVVYRPGMGHHGSGLFVSDIYESYPVLVKAVIYPVDVTAGKRKDGPLSTSLRYFATTCPPYSSAISTSFFAGSKQFFLSLMFHVINKAFIRKVQVTTKTSCGSGFQPLSVNTTCSFQITGINNCD